MAAAGTLTVTVVNCRGVKGKDWFSETDPYVVLRCGATKCKTRVKKDAGADADFNEIFTFHVDSPLEELEVRVLDKDFLIDELMGTGFVSLGHVLEVRQWFGDCQLHDKKGRDNGLVTLALRFEK